jgi:uncharacterized integral membrane protein
MRVLRRLLGIAVFVGLLIVGWQFAARNGELVVVRHPAGEFQARALWAVLLAAFASGVVLTALAASVRGARIRLISRRYRKLVESLRAEVHQLRSLPLADSAPASDAAPALPAAPGSTPPGSDSPRLGPRAVGSPRVALSGPERGS